MTWLSKVAHVLRGATATFLDPPEAVRSRGLRGWASWFFLVLGAAIDTHDELWVEWQDNEEILPQEYLDAMAVEEEWTP